ncbi:hypothetical protein BOTCAL_0638g00040 [Botryotinia calthae]|uniref:BTB domain-containing protein n=1 Tax=Botryotinia calthae TaxID=38488 RepID=A0A4Y8CI24_9HELO|nr:hypothetical protein BOTCAL_0638g00040 [Botryotinia calthae]
MTDAQLVSSAKTTFRLLVKLYTQAVTSMTSTQVVKFSLTDQEPDTRITLFQLRVLHVHSSILKLYSAYFRRFMDSPDKVPAPSGAKWKYDWIGEAEEDGSWYVVDKRGQESKVSLSSDNLTSGV